MTLQASVLLIRVAGTLIYGNFALLFESFHILTDLLVTIAVYAAIRLSHSKYSKKYSYGLFRIEDLVSLSIAIIIAFTAVDLLRSVPTVNQEYNLQSAAFQLVSIVPLFLSGVVKIIGGRNLNSPSLVSDGYHNYSDVFVGLGVGGGLLISFATKIGLFYYAAIVIAAIGILYTSFKIGKDSVVGIMDLPKDKRVIPKITEIVNENEEVTEVRSIKARWAGPAIFAQIVVTVNSKLTIEEAHDVADSLEKKILNEISDVKDVVIHIEPSRNPERVVIIPISESGKIEEKTSRSHSYLVVAFKEIQKISSKEVKIPQETIGLERNSQKVLLIARQNLVTDAIVLNAGEIFSSLFRVNHIELWKAQSDSVHDNLELLLQNKLEKLPSP